MRFDPQTIGSGWDAAEQLSSDARPHLHGYLRMLDGQLRGARTGRLSPTWRHGMASFARFFPPGVATDDPLRAVCQPTPTPAMFVDPVLTGCLMRLPAAERQEHIISAKVAGVDLLAACAWFDVAELPFAAWEPHQAAGDWRAALDAWYRDKLRVHDLVQRARRHDADGLASDAGMQRDLIEASYLAGLASGTGTDNEWQDWLTGRTYQWADKGQAERYRLSLLDPDRWAVIDRDDQPADPYGIDTQLPSLPGPIPEYWTLGDRR